MWRIFTLLSLVLLSSAQQDGYGYTNDGNFDFSLQGGGYSTAVDNTAFASSAGYQQGGYGNSGFSSTNDPFGDTTGQTGMRLEDSIPGIPAVDYPIFPFVPPTSFTCDGKLPGYYADTETGCQAFHICYDDRMASFLCPNGTTFHQQFFVCDWWFNSDCSQAPNFYSVNANLFVTGQPLHTTDYGSGLPVPVTSGYPLTTGQQSQFGYGQTSSQSANSQFSLGQTTLSLNNQALLGQTQVNDQQLQQFSAGQTTQQVQQLGAYQQNQQQSFSQSTFQQTNGLQNNNNQKQQNANKLKKQSKQQQKNRVAGSSIVSAGQTQPVTQQPYILNVNQQPLISTQQTVKQPLNQAVNQITQNVNSQRPSYQNTFFSNPQPSSQQSFNQIQQQNQQRNGVAASTTQNKSYQNTFFNQAQANNFNGQNNQNNGQTFFNNQAQVNNVNAQSTRYKKTTETSLKPTQKTPLFQLVTDSPSAAFEGFINNNSEVQNDVEYDVQLEEQTITEPATELTPQVASAQELSGISQVTEEQSELDNTLGSEPQTVELLNESPVTEAQSLIAASPIVTVLSSSPQPEVQPNLQVNQGQTTEGTVLKSTSATTAFTALTTEKGAEFKPSKQVFYNPQLSIQQPTTNKAVNTQQQVQQQANSAFQQATQQTPSQQQTAFQQQPVQQVFQQQPVQQQIAFQLQPVQQQIAFQQQPVQQQIAFQQQPVQQQIAFQQQPVQQQITTQQQSVQQQIAYQQQPVQQVRVQQQQVKQQPIQQQIVQQQFSQQQAAVQQVAFNTLQNGKAANQPTTFNYLPSTPNAQTQYAYKPQVAVQPQQARQVAAPKPLQAQQVKPSTVTVPSNPLKPKQNYGQQQYGAQSFGVAQQQIINPKVVRPAAPNLLTTKPSNYARSQQQPMSFKPSQQLQTQQQLPQAVKRQQVFQQQAVTQPQVALKQQQQNVQYNTQQSTNVIKGSATNLPQQSGQFYSGNLNNLYGQKTTQQPTGNNYLGKGHSLFRRTLQSLQETQVEEQSPILTDSEDSQAIGELHQTSAPETSITGQTISDDDSPQESSISIQTQVLPANTFQRYWHGYQ